MENNIYKAQSINLYKYHKKIWFKHYLLKRWDDLKTLTKGLFLVFLIVTIFLAFLIFPVFAVALFFTF